MIRKRILVFVATWVALFTVVILLRRDEAPLAVPSGAPADETASSAPGSITKQATSPAPAKPSVATLPATRGETPVGAMGGGFHAGELRELNEFLALVDLDRVTHRASKSGSWSDPAVWGGEVPDEGARVHIPEGIDVTLSDADTDHLKSLRVDGALQLAPEENVKLQVDTLVVNEKGSLTAGSETAPISDDKEALISIEALDDPNDDEAARRNSARLIALGEVSMHGEPKTSMAMLSQAPQIGDRELVLDAAPSNWKPGDVVVLGGARQSREELESLQIEYVRGKRVGLTPISGDDQAPKWPGLAEDYSPNRDNLAFAVNITRNVGISSPPLNDEMAGEYPRGSVTFAGSASTSSSLNNVGAYGLGVNDATLEGQDQAVDRPAIEFQNSSKESVAQVNGLALVDAPESGVKFSGNSVNLTDSVAYDENGGGWLTSSGSASRLVWARERKTPGALSGAIRTAP